MYYLLDTQDAIYPCRWIEDEPFFEDINFDLGRKHEGTVPEPLEFTLEPLDEDADDCGPEMPAVFVENFLLFSDDFVAALREFGVDNFDTYEAALHDPDNDETYSNYKVINIIGLVAAADMKKSDATVHGTPEIDVDFDGLVIDEDKAGGKMFFRLAESTNAILVHEDLKNFLVDKGFGHVCFNDPEQSAV